ncbi:MAG TPA: hypothetical protein V6C72_18535, partial [Chroococcales cyanobacterium]
GEKVAFGLIVQLVLEGKPQSLIEEVLDFSLSVNLPVTLEDVGIAARRSDFAHCLDAIATRATAAGETAHNEPFVVTPVAVADAIVAADGLGRRKKSLNGKAAPAGSRLKEHEPQPI